MAEGSSSTTRAAKPVVVKAKSQPMIITATVQQLQYVIVQLHLLFWLSREDDSSYIILVDLWYFFAMNCAHILKLFSIVGIVPAK
jgi:hypothetical protein